MARLHESGYRTLGLVEAADCLRRREPFPERAFVVTFDDGYQSVYDEAFPVLQQFGVSATVFLTVGEKGDGSAGGRLPSFEGRSMLSWSEMREMQRRGISFGAHTLTHPDLTRLPSYRIEAEVFGSKRIIEDALGIGVDCFAYPYGRFDSRSHDIVRQHFSYACTDRLGLITRKSDHYLLERVDAYYLRTEALFDLMLSRLFPWYIRARSISRSIRRAVARNVA